MGKSPFGFAKARPRSRLPFRSQGHLCLEMRDASRQSHRKRMQFLSACQIKQNSAENHHFLREIETSVKIKFSRKDQISKVGMCFEYVSFI
jgi:hypothetical protein